MASSVALFTISWQAPPSPLPSGSSPVASYNILIQNTQGFNVFQKNGLPATTTSYTTTAADNLAFTNAGSPYKVMVTAIDASGVASLTPGIVLFEAIPPVYTPPIPQGVSVGTVNWS